MSTGRNALVDALRAVVPSHIRVEPYAQDMARPAFPTVMVRVDTVEPMPQARLTHRVYAYALVVLASSEDTSGPADDQLDQALEDVLDAVDQGREMSVLPHWTQARRANYGETDIPCYEVDLTTRVEKSPTPTPAPPE